MVGDRLWVGGFGAHQPRAERIGAVFGIDQPAIEPQHIGNRQHENERCRELQAPHREREAILPIRSEEHTSELQSLMRNSYAVFCLKKKKTTNNKHKTNNT